MKKLLSIILLAVIASSYASHAQTYKIVDTGQKTFYNNTQEISAPDKADSFYGQDAQYSGNQPSYTDKGNGVIQDNVTGLMWTKTLDLNDDGVIDAKDKLSAAEARVYCDTLVRGGYFDWRLPSIKELYSLIVFTGIDPSGWDGTNTDLLTPFIDTQYFDFGYGDVSADERIIDAQMATTTMYVGEAMMSDAIMFGVNFADGRIKGYPTGPMPGQTEDKGYYVYFVRGNEEYGKNKFHDNGDGTISDSATYLMWTQNDNGNGLNWEEALDWVKAKNNENYLGHNDWRLPNVKELQSIVDYTRSPKTTNSAAIDPVFNCSQITDEGGETNYPFYWSGTTHANMHSGNAASYVCFGEALGFMEMPPNSGNYNLMDVHGAGAQRSDPKAGDPADYPAGHGPQGDVIRIYNYVRLVRDLTELTNVEETGKNEILIYPNPATDYINITYNTDSQYGINSDIMIYNNLGECLLTITKNANNNQQINIESLTSGVYFIRIGDIVQKIVVI